jgi:hypothetical protein
MGDFIAICEDERNLVRTSSSRDLSWSWSWSTELPGAVESGLRLAGSEEDDDAAVCVVSRRLEFSPSTSRRALRNASCSNRASLSSSSVSARFIRSVATIVLAFARRQ